MVYTATQINTSPTIVGKAGAAMTAPVDVRGKAIKFDAAGDVVVASTAGETVMGIAILTNDETVKAGQDIDIQVKEIGVALAGAEIKAGAELAVDATGALKTATAGQFVVATALEAAAAAGKFIRVQITKYTKA